MAHETTPIDAGPLKLDSQLCFALHAASRAFDRVYRRLLIDTGLTYPQYLTMLVLWEHGPMPVKRMGELLRLDFGTLSPLLKRLEAAGLVLRERSRHDERSVLVSLTPAGEELRRKAELVPPQISAAVALGAEESAQLLFSVEQLTGRLDLAATAEL